MRNIVLTTVPEPKKDCSSPILLTDETIEERKQKILTRMHKLYLDKLVIYGDVEHGSNFEYLVGFLYRDVYDQEDKEMAKLYKKTIKYV